MAPPENKLKRILDKAEFALGMTERARDQVNFPQGLWYHTVGMLNAFYALTEELAKSTSNSPDTLLRESVKSWRDANAVAVRAFFGRARDTATHQGEISVEGFMVWEDDHWHDTSFPVSKARVTIRDSKIQGMEGEHFLDRCKEAFTFMRDGIRQIDADYIGRGGSTHALPKPEDISAFLKGFEL